MTASAKPRVAVKKSDRRETAVREGREIPVREKIREKSIVSKIERRRKA